MIDKKALCFTSDIYNQNYYFLKYWTREQFERVVGIDSNNSGGMTVFKDGNIYIWIESIEESESLTMARLVLAEALIIGVW